MTNSKDVKDERLFGENSSERMVALMDNKLYKVGGLGIIMKTAASKANLKWTLTTKSSKELLTKN